MGVRNRAEQVRISPTLSGVGRALLIAVCVNFSAGLPAFAQSEGGTAAKSPRIVAPQLITPPDVAPSDLQRIEPRGPLGGSLETLPGYVPPATIPSPRPEAKMLKADPLLFKPLVEQAGVIVAEGRIITLAGIDPLPVEETCGADAGSPWPCGMIARTAFRNFLRGRAVRCDFPDGDLPEKVTAPCRLGKSDLAEWLVANGWARIDGDTYKEQAEAAENAKLGVYGAPPRELAASLRAAPTGSTGAGELPSGTVSILPADIEPAPAGTSDAVAPQTVAPASSGAPGALPPPSQPLAE